MAEEKARYNRILFIDYEIAQGAYPNARELAERYEGVSPRTIKRDIEWLRDFHAAPIEYDTQRRGYYYTEPNWRLPALQMAESEIFAMTLAEEVLKQYRNTPLYGTLSTLFAKLQAQLPDKVTMDPQWLPQRATVFHSPTPQIRDDVWEAIFESLRSNRSLYISYSTPQYEGYVERLVSPYHAVANRGEWYAICFDETKEAMRIFGLSRMGGATLTEHRFEVPADFSVEQFADEYFGVYHDSQEYNVELWVAPHIAPYIREREWHDTQHTAEHPDGSLTLTFRSNQLDEVRRWLLSWGAGIVAKRPPELVEAVREDLRESLRLHEGAQE
jgi:predicted DNA-binding transcriptional regulator YafY